ncbi:MAG: DUF4342 domain-containing protein [Clostridioides sp.]|jgi:hypothetical protein|nr:DUF4342 domain-containing protein [Clostridioides sp.]
MVTIEMIDELRKRVNVSFEDARDALEKCDCDVLEAIIYLEKNGKTSSWKNTFKEVTNQDTSDMKRDFKNWFDKILKLGNNNRLIVRKKANILVNVPLTVVVIGLVVGFYVVIPLLLLAVFTGHRIEFAGIDVSKTKANSYSEKVEDAVKEFKVELNKKERDK